MIGSTKIFDDAIAVWHTAELRGGHLGLPQGLTGLSGGAFSIYVRIRDASGKWGASIVSQQSQDKKAGFRLFAGDLGAGMALAFELATDWPHPQNDRPLMVSVPVAMIGPDAWHDIIARFTGPKLELFADGVLVDEEWPAGALKQAVGAPFLVGAESPGDGVKSAFHGAIDHVAVWDRALSDDEIATLSGGREQVLKRDREILGDESPRMQYWRPRGHNAFAGDCIPFFHQGRFHLFYLFDRRHHLSKWRFGAHQWAHASTTDLVHWVHHPMAIPITEAWEGSICTGSMFHHHGVYYGFYATRMADGAPGQLTLATSGDGIHFTKSKPFAQLRAPYNPHPARDPVVFRHGETGLFHMLVTTELANPAIVRHGGCLAHLLSSDLKTWRQEAPFIVPGYTDQPECPDHFFWRGWYYLIFSNHGVARYRMSRGPLGPWQRPKVDVFDAPQAAVLKTAAFSGDRRIGAAFLRMTGFGGHVVFREIIQHSDGSLGTRFPAEMIPPSANPLSLPFEALTAGVSGDAHRASVSALEGFSVAGLSGVPRNARITLAIRPRPNCSFFGLCLRGSGQYQQGHELRFEPFREKVGWRTPDSASTAENERSAIYGVEGLDRPFTLDIIAKDDILDVCIDDRRTLVVRATPDLSCDRLFFFAQNGEVSFEEVEVRPLA